MLRKLRPNSIYDVMATIACCGVLAGGTAYAADTIRSSDIVDGEVKSVDIGNNEIGSADVKDGSLNTFDVHSFIGEDVIDGTLTSADIQNNSLGNGDFLDQAVDSRVVANDSLLQSDIRAGAVTNDEVLDNTLVSADIQDGSLKGADLQCCLSGSFLSNNSVTGTEINEATLNLPPLPKASFVNGGKRLNADGTLSKIAERGSLTPGAYVALATANTTVSGPGVTTAACELHDGGGPGGYIGGAIDRRVIPSGDVANRTLSMNGGIFVEASEFSGSISLWCKSQSGLGETVDSSQILVIRLDGFF